MTVLSMSFLLSLLPGAPGRRRTGRRASAGGAPAAAGRGGSPRGQPWCL